MSHRSLAFCRGGGSAPGGFADPSANTCHKKSWDSEFIAGEVGGSEKRGLCGPSHWKYLSVCLGSLPGMGAAAGWISNGRFKCRFSSCPWEDGRTGGRWEAMWCAPEWNWVILALGMSHTWGWRAGREKPPQSIYKGPENILSSRKYSPDSLQFIKEWGVLNNFIWNLKCPMSRMKFWLYFCGVERCLWFLVLANLLIFLSTGILL